MHDTSANRAFAIWNTNSEYPPGNKTDRSEEKEGSIYTQQSNQQKSSNLSTSFYKYIILIISTTEGPTNTFPANNIVHMKCQPTHFLPKISLETIHSSEYKNMSQRYESYEAGNAQSFLFP
jgi:hypothetical protein